MLFSQALFKKMAAGPQPPPRMTIESGAYCFQCVLCRDSLTFLCCGVLGLSEDVRSFTSSYIIENGVCYLTLTDKGYPKKLAYQVC